MKTEITSAVINKYAGLVAKDIVDPMLQELDQLEQSAREQLKKGGDAAIKNFELEIKEIHDARVGVGSFVQHVSRGLAKRGVKFEVSGKLD